MLTDLTSMCMSKLINPSQACDPGLYRAYGFLSPRFIWRLLLIPWSPPNQIVLNEGVCVSVDECTEEPSRHLASDRDFGTHGVRCSNPNSDR